MTYEYSYIISTTCYCGYDDLEVLNIFDSENLTTSHICDSGYLVQQTTGLRDFLQPLEITSFNVIFIPGLVIVTNETLNIEFVVNEGSLAGYKIDSKDGKSVFYTSYNKTTLIYDNFGVYEVEVMALNEISSMTGVNTIYVFEAIEATLVNHTKIVQTDTDVVFTVDVIKGNNLTCDVDYGDGSSIETLFNSNSSLSFVYTHQYTMEQHFDINITCYNNKSQVTNMSHIISINPIANFTLLAPYSVIFGENVTLEVSITQGSNILMKFYINDVNVLNQFYVDPVNISLHAIGEKLYNKTGKHRINVTVSNPVSGPFILSKIVYVEVEINNAVLNFNMFSAVSKNVTFELSIENGSSIDIHIDFGNSSLNESVVLENDSQTFNWRHNFYHQYLQPGVYFITCTLENSVSNMTVVGIIYIEVAVNDIDLVAMDVEDPVDFVNLTFLISNYSLPHPTNALINISLGNGDSLDEIPAEFVVSSLTVLYNYTVNGIFTVTVNLWNNISAINFTEVLVVGRPVSKLTADTKSYYIAINEVFTVSIDIGSGSEVSYTVVYSDGTENTTQNIYTYPTSNYVVQKSFSQVGIYLVDIFANNSFNTEAISMQLYIQEPVEGLMVLTRHIGKLTHPFKFIIKLNLAGTNSCFNFDLVNRTQLVGGFHCQSKPEFTGMNYTYGEGKTIIFDMTFYEQGYYDMFVNASNEVSYTIFTNTFLVLKFPCTYPEVKIYGFSLDEDKPTMIYSADDLVIRAISDTYCDPLQTVLFEWIITPLDPGIDPVSMNLPTLPYLIIPANSLEYGRYQINVTVLIQNYLEFNYTSTAYIDITQTPLVLLVKGDNARSVRSGSSLIMDASWSYDPDYPLLGIQYNLTWFCWYPDTQFTKFDINTAVLHNMISPSCFPTLNQEHVNWTILTLPSILLVDDTYHFVANMTSGDRVKLKYQKVEILSEDLPELVMK